VPIFEDRGVWLGQRGGSLTVVNLGFLDRSRYFSFQVGNKMKRGAQTKKLSRGVQQRVYCRRSVPAVDSFVPVTEHGDEYVCETSRRLRHLHHRFRDGAENIGLTCLTTTLYPADKLLVLVFVRAGIGSRSLAPLKDPVRWKLQ
jgi:hypothetical protein